MVSEARTPDRCPPREPARGTISAVRFYVRRSTVVRTAGFEAQTDEPKSAGCEKVFKEQNLVGHKTRSARHGARLCPGRRYAGRQ